MVSAGYPSTTLFPSTSLYPGGADFIGGGGTALSTPIDRYTCYVYKTMTGQVVAELPLADQPQWSHQLNQSSTITVKVRSGDQGGLSLAKLYQLVVPKFFSLAILWGDYVCQAGPVLPYDIDDTSNTLLQLGAGDFWSLMAGRLLVNPTWNPATTRITDSSADTNLTDTLGNIALTLVRNTVTSIRPGSALPVDIPANTGTGILLRNYPGYDMADVATRLKELTQESGGPDIDFQPYLVQDSTGRYIRHAMRVGRASDGYLVQPGTAPHFDYGTTLRAVKISGDGSNLATSTWVKGSGDKYSMLYGSSSNSALTDLGWPVSDFVDSNHISSTTQTQLDAWAAADLTVHGKASEQWTAYVDANLSPRLGAYDPGTFGVYNVTKHMWLPEQMYTGRILGLSNGRTAGEVTHIIEGRGPF